ncbi:hypothetical protein IMZ31_23490 (plasmid) [Pontibacillus sp. ALD_SL1]|uniref:hypothetical protein n=1 Tax=Pontibacillus sp. ALD_SL1 TaxID=2777185 RepID=UPI001A961361|nr:hypothetical protein [Pontibacillus sp. ALD_SL1]QST02417.1 hypothetical protein IMZ31_23490 [Pontibacillus sp. ALD_SL1]
MVTILIGKSGCGKSSIESHFERVISFTTRPPRKGEVSGVDYYFYSHEEFEELLEKGEILEHHTYSNGFTYGVTKKEAKRIKSLPHVVAVMNGEGATNMKKILEEEGIAVRVVWVHTDQDIRVKRLHERSAETGETLSELEERIEESHRDGEIALCDAILSNNGTVEEAVSELEALMSWPSCDVTETRK